MCSGAEPHPGAGRGSLSSGAGDASPPAQNHGDMERRSPTGIARERETRTNNAAHDRAGARNPPRQRRPPPISPLRTTYRHPRRITGTWSAGLRPASRGSAKPAPTTLAPIARERETSADDGAPYRREWRTPCSIRTALFAALRAAVPTRGRRSLACRSRRAPKVKGRILPFTLSPAPAWQRTKFAAVGFLRARQYTTRAESRGHGAPVSDRHRAGARNPPQQRCAVPT